MNFCKKTRIPLSELVNHLKYNCKYSPYSQILEKC